MSSRIIRAGDRVKTTKIQTLTQQQTSPSDKDAYARGFEDGQRFGLELALETLRCMQDPAPSINLPESLLGQESSRYE
jgi:hypothetical protein